jgi:hypothetical protein
MVAHAIVVLACIQFVLLCFMYLVLYSFNITLSWSASMLLDSVLINFICNFVLCMHEFTFMYNYVYMSLCFILMSMHACFFAL